MTGRLIWGIAITGGLIGLAVAFGGRKTTYKVFVEEITGDGVHPEGEPWYWRVFAVQGDVGSPAFNSRELQVDFNGTPLTTGKKGERTREFYYATEAAAAAAGADFLARLKRGN